jgi:hypothetical protein
MGADCRSMVQASGAMPVDTKFDGPSIDSQKFEGQQAPNVGKR